MYHLRTAVLAADMIDSRRSPLKRSGEEDVMLQAPGLWFSNAWALRC